MDRRSHNWPRGPMDKASAYGAGDCRFESCRGHYDEASSIPSIAMGSYGQHLHACNACRCYPCSSMGRPAAKASRGFEPRSLDSESRVLTLTPRGQLCTCKHQNPHHEASGALASIGAPRSSCTCKHKCPLVIETKNLGATWCSKSLWHITQEKPWLKRSADSCLCMKHLLPSSEAMCGIARAAIAQLGECQTEDLKVPGSIPGLGILACVGRALSAAYWQSIPLSCSSTQMPGSQAGKNHEAATGHMV